jgi:uncharacterized protein (TIGR02145 family)
MILLPFLGFSQTDYEFWFAAPAVTNQFVAPGQLLYQNLNQPILLYFTTADGPATITVDQPANPSFTPIVLIVNNTSTGMVDLTTFIDSIENKPSNSILNRGLRISSDKRITCLYEVQSPYNAETWSLLGRNALGYEFIIPSQHHYGNWQFSDPPARNTFDIVATEDSTTVRIVPKVAIVGHNANDTIAFILNRGQTWSGSAVSEDPTAHLGGSFVFSDKPIAVTISDDAVLIPSSSINSVDLAGGQLIPRHLSGMDFVIFSQSLLPERIYAYAYENSTLITFNDSVRVFSRLINRGDSIEMSGLWLRVNHIQSNKPILVFHFYFPNENYPTGSSPQATSAIVPPITCAGSRRVVITRTPPLGVFPEFDLFFITKKENLPYFEFSPLSSGLNIDTNSYTIVPGTYGQLVETGIGSSGYPVGFTTIVTNTKGRFQLSIASKCFANNLISYAKNAYFSDFSTLYLGTDRKICPGDSTLLDAGYGRNTYLWNTGDTSQTIWVKNPGNYWVQTTEQGNCNLSDTINISYFSFTPVNLGPDRQFCNGDSILLNAGVGRNWYQWSTGALTQSIWVKSTGTYWVMVPDVYCIIYDTIQITTTPVPSITNNKLTDTICSGESTNIQLTSNIPGTNFHWTASLTSGTITGFSADSGLVINQVLTNLLPTPGIVTYHITPKIGSCTGATVDFQVTVIPGDSVKVDIAPFTNNVCAGTSVTFTAVPTNPGLTPFYQWKVNGGNQGTNSTVFTYVPTNGDLVSCILTSSLTVCVSNNPASSIQYPVSVNPNLPVTVTLTSAPATICAGQQVTFTAHPGNGGTTPVYQWYLNSNPTGINSDTYTFTPVNGDLISCTLTSNETCTTNNPASSIQHQVSVSPIQAVSITITPSQNPFCLGSPVTFTAFPIAGGTTPHYSWIVNGLSVGSDLNTYTYNPVNGDLVWCILTSSEPCTIQNPVPSAQCRMTQNNSLPAGVSINAVPNPFCPGSSVTITATPSNGGPLPTYQWKVNGINTGTGSSYTYNPVNGDSVRCIMTSNLSCVTGNPASSPKIILSGTLAPGVSFAACFDTITTINAKPIKLKGGIPLGGTYSGPGVNSITGVFTPALAGVGTHTITYSYTNAALCSALAHTHIINYPLSIVNCGNPITDPRDNKVYQTVQIGSQCWLASNLNFGSILASSQDQRDNCITEKYCYNDNPVNCANHGGLYQWDEVMRFDETPADQGYCPPGWHIPSENDWNTLFAVYINSGFAGSPLKYSGYSGFNALLSGARHINRGWDFNGFATFFWSSTPRSDNKTWAHGMNEADPSVSLYPSSRVNAFSVRCLKD